MENTPNGSAAGSSPTAPRMYLCVKGLIFDADGQVLLLKRTLDTPVDPGKWDLPGGKLDPGELFDDAFKREVREETGLDVHIVGIAGAWDWRMPGRHVAFLFVRALSECSQVTLSDEHVDWKWVRPERVVGLDIAPQFVRLFEGLAGAKQ